MVIEQVIPYRDMNIGEISIVIRKAAGDYTKEIFH